MIGAFTGILFLLNILVMAFFIVFFGFIRYLIPIKPIRNAITNMINDIFPAVWTDINGGILRLAGKIQWEIKGEGTLNPQHWYFVFANHQSWADIVVMQHAFNRKIPLLKFFLKKELLWSLPMGGLACWMLDYPFMKRYNKAYLRKHPEKKQADIETTRQACERFKQRPTSVMNFLEGTRFTSQKQKDRSSPYSYLLRPKAGGVAFVVSELKDYIKEVIDVTITYADENPTFWKFLCGKISKVSVHYQVIPLEEQLYGDYYQNPAFRRQFQRWINGLWQEKDKVIATTLSQELVG